MILIKKVIAIIFLFYAGGNSVIAKNVPNEYDKLVKKADSLDEAKDYKNSALTYSSAFKINGWKDYSKYGYNAACSWAKANNSDSAFSCLERMVNQSSYDNYNEISKDKDLIS